MNVVIPMAGEGHRFQVAGYTEPKMLIPVAGRPMLHWAMDSLLPHIQEEKFIFVCLDKHLQHTRLAQVIKEICPKAIIHSLPKVTGGQAETVVAAKKHFNLSNSLLIYNCDTYTESSIADTITSHEGDGLISVFPSSDPAYSYITLDSENLVREVKEKEVISSWATTGMYYFSSTEKFLAVAAHAMTEPKPSEGEWYVAPLYNRIIQEGGRIAVDYAKQCLPLGSPKQLEQFEHYLETGERV